MPLRTIVYVDGFNLYFRLLANRPSVKWLNIKKLAEILLSPANEVEGVKYFSARVSGRIDGTAPAQQQLNDTSTRGMGRPGAIRPPV
jgi:hypothetical protein